VATDKRIRVVGGLIENDGKLLIVQRKPGGDFGGKWEFPGGKVRAGETDEKALARELLEELQITTEIGEKYFETEFDYPTLSVHLIFYRCRTSGEPKLVEHERMEWVSFKELSRFDFLEADRPLIQTLIRSE
jgi:8-oxo-dGTP diphosphatase